jgi:hypothetical protein
VATGLDSSGNPTEVTASHGVITFNGAGGYTLTGSYVDNTVGGGKPQALNVAAGTYAIGANGAGYIANPLAPADASNLIRGAVAQGVFVASDTENSGIACPGNPANTCSSFDIFVAIPAGAVLTKSSLTTPYQLAILDFTGGNAAAILNGVGLMTPDGAGGIGTILLSGQASNQTGSTLSQYLTGATYAVNADSGVTLTLPAPEGVASAPA